jgi:hypothetical protein
MKKRIVTLSVVIAAFAVGTNSQEIKSAPNLEVCNAQVNLWVAQMDLSRPYSPEKRKVMSPLTSKDILDREGVIDDCMSTDIRELKAVPEGPQRAAIAQKLGIRLDGANTLLNIYSMEQRMRYFHFISRHNLMAKFDEEDQAGER